MDLRKEILKARSKTQKDKVVRFVGNDPVRFKTLVDVFLAGPYRVTQRASWPISYCVEAHPELIKPHLKVVLDLLDKPALPDFVKRNIIRLLQFIEIPKRYQGRVTDICFSFLQDPKQSIAVRVFSMFVLSQISRDIPEIKPEIKILIEDHLPYGSPAFVSRANKVLKDLNK